MKKNYSNNEKITASRVIVVISTMVCYFTEQITLKKLDMEQSVATLFFFLYEAFEAVTGLKGKEAVPIMKECIDLIAKIEEEDYENDNIKRGEK